MVQSITELRDSLSTDLTSVTPHHDGGTHFAAGILELAAEMHLGTVRAVTPHAGELSEAAVLQQ